MSLPIKVQAFSLLFWVCFALVSWLFKPLHSLKRYEFMAYILAVTILWIIGSVIFFILSL